MANRIVLNEVSYHGSGAIKEIVTEVKGKNLKKAFLYVIVIFLSFYTLIVLSYNDYFY